MLHDYDKKNYASTTKNERRNLLLTDRIPHLLSKGGGGEATLT